MGMIIKDKNRGYVKLSDSFLKGIDQTNDIEQLRKYLRYFSSIVNGNLSEPDALRKNIHLLLELMEGNFAIKDETEIKSKLLRDICRDDCFDNQ
jgi:hypothetical protein